MPPKRRRGDNDPESHIGFLDSLDEKPRTARRGKTDDLDLDRIW